MHVAVSTHLSFLFARISERGWRMGGFQLYAGMGAYAVLDRAEILWNENAILILLNTSPLTRTKTLVNNLLMSEF